TPLSSRSGSQPPDTTTRSSELLDQPKPENSSTSRTLLSWTQCRAELQRVETGRISYLQASVRNVTTSCIGTSIVCKESRNDAASSQKTRRLGGTRGRRRAPAAVHRPERVVLPRHRRSLPPQCDRLR